jgi:hypothetical protein
MPSFAYSALDKATHQIRLLKISPQSARECDALVDCTLIVVTLNEAPSYTALSYVWGDETNRRPVLVNGSETSVNANLEEALRHLQREDGTVLIWADALCINQRDKAERSHQIQLMRNIYENASMISIWLGPSDETSDGVMKFLDDTGRQALEIGISGLNNSDVQNILGDSDTKPHLVSIGDRLDNMIKQIGYEIPWLDLNSLLSRPWFSRIWVLQEVSVPKKGAVEFVCGKKGLSFERFTAILLFLEFFRTHWYAVKRPNYEHSPQAKQFLADMSRGYNRIPVGRVITSRRNFQQEGNRKRESLFALLNRLHVVYTSMDSIGATEPRDRIYALLGLAEGQPSRSIVPNYASSLCEVFTDTAEALLNYGNFDILVLSQFPKSQPLDGEPELPSWVPDWKGHIQRRYGSYRSDNCHEASGQREPHISFEIPPGGQKILHIKGCTVDTIAKLGDPWLPTILNWQEWTNSASRCAAFFSSIAEFCKESDKLNHNIYKYSSQRLEAHWRIPCANKARQPREICRPSSSGIELFEAYTYINNGSQDPSGLLGEFSFSVSAYRVLMGDQFNRRPFISTQGYVGLIPCHSKPGDVICILYGCVVPFVLRKNEVGYQLVGEAYVHGIMDGEFVEKNPNRETFDLY